MFLTDFYKFLRDHPSISTDNIFPHVLPTDHNQDGVTFGISGTERTLELSGQTDDIQANTQVDVWSTDFESAFALAEEIESALLNFSGDLVPGGTNVGRVSMDNMFTGFENDTGYFRVTFLITIYFCK